MYNVCIYACVYIYERMCVCVCIMCAHVCIDICTYIYMREWKERSISEHLSSHLADNDHSQRSFLALRSYT